MNKKNIVVIGGGTGSLAVLSGLKNYKLLSLSAIVCMTDDGGSNRVVRDEFGLLPLSDLRKSIIALSGKSPDILRKIFTYRFDKGEGLAGHTLGNLIMMAVSDMTGSEKAAIRTAAEFFNVQGNIIPVTYDLVKLCARYSDGKLVQGEHLIDVPEENTNARVTELFLEPKAKANADAISAIDNAQYIILGPGDLYTSLLSNIVVDGMAKAIKDSPAKFIYITNLMSENGETRGMTASDLVEEVSKYCQRTPDIILLNNGPIPTKVLRKYKRSGEHPILDDLDDNSQDYQVLRADIINKFESEAEKGDVLNRSLIRHDAKKLAHTLVKLFENANQ